MGSRGPERWEINSSTSSDIARASVPCKVGRPIQIVELMCLTTNKPVNLHSCGPSLHVLTVDAVEQRKCDGRG